MSEKLLIIDTDCGIDDAQAILLALAAPHARVLAVTCVFGNASLDDVCQNVIKVIAVGQREQIPVFRGSVGPLVGTANDTPCDHFGIDGLGDVLEDRDPRWEKKIQREHAVSAMLRLVAENPKQVSLVALGPLTNLALAVKMNPSFPGMLKELYIMGGNMEGKGNLTPSAEFNFAMDPEAAYVVLEEFLCPTYLTSWEYACRNALSWEFFEELTNQDTVASRFMKAITSRCWAYSREALRKKRDVYFGPGFVSFDSYAVAACVDPSVVAESVCCPVRVELWGAMCRGMMVLDRVGILNKKHTITVFTKCHKDKLEKLLIQSLTESARSTDNGK
ncbi:inosine-uridine preferring nucleoside hydrolase [Corythoichthys intestinalis]|uniref:inosine-uridine preferring nucleoside hydrolase n=1 Tax=Corythoichthys intestinalis TaxID=161448 RepID=UPI0025A528FF|nr:inosine-uridine preferring nucleoside hydrolase [Corythoichthys intestinalis]XP_057696833.1 inosine-uridine preferring nucleoside hydrolase [Corythoichthys intestinalis]XP_061790374.1 inosine-uridine preferring nucleoside hydrolase-like [Nerophis lumbriciformis]